jgi:uncharacterized protein DUF222
MLSPRTITADHRRAARCPVTVAAAVGLAEEYGASSTAMLLRQLLKLPPGVAKRRVEDANDVCAATTPTRAQVEPLLPDAAKAVRSGAMSEEQLGVPHTLLRQLPDAVPATVRGEVEQRLVTEAQRFDPAQLATLAARIRTYLDQDGMLRSETKAAERMELCFTPDGDTVRGPWPALHRDGRHRAIRPSRRWPTRRASRPATTPAATR